MWMGCTLSAYIYYPVLTVRNGREDSQINLSFTKSRAFSYRQEATQLFSYLLYYVGPCNFLNRKSENCRLNGSFVLFKTRLHTSYFFTDISLFSLQSFVCIYIYIYIYIYTCMNIRGAYDKFPDFLYGHLNCRTLDNSLCYCYISYEMTDQYSGF